MSTTSSSPEPLYTSARRAALAGLLVNLALGIVKLVGGLVGNTFALVADAVNSIGDSFSSVAVLVGLHVAQRPPDSQHPYGHTRAEAVAGLSVAILIAVSALHVGWEAIHRIDSSHHIPPIWTLWIAGVNVVLKEILYWVNLLIGRRTGSRAVLANAWDHRSDALCSLAVLVGIGMVRWGGGTRWMGADEIAALMVVVIILYAAYRLFQTSASELLDRQADDSLVAEIRRRAASVPGVRGVETLWVRKSGLEYFADIHIEVDPDMTVREGHRISHAVKDRLLHEFAPLRDVLVHLEPHPHGKG